MALKEEDRKKLEDLKKRYRQLTPEQIALLQGSEVEVSQELIRLQRLAYRRTIDQMKAEGKATFVITCWHCAKQVNTTDKGLRYCSEECRTRNPINLDLFDTFNLEKA